MSIFSKKKIDRVQKKASTDVAIIMLLFIILKYYIAQNIKL